MKSLIVTITMCVCVFIWGTIAAVRMIPDSNYHAPAPRTALEVYQDCHNHTSGKAEALDRTCRELAGLK